MHCRAMASPLLVVAFNVAGAIFVCNGFLKFVLGLWGYTIGWIVLSSVWFYLAYRVSRVPVFTLENGIIEVLDRPAFPPRRIEIQEIKNIKMGGLEAKIILITGKSVKVPLCFLRKKDRDVVVRAIEMIMAPEGGIHQR